MMLDGCFMLTAKGNDQYHDKCISLAATDKKKTNVLIIGGGDFGLVRNLFKTIDVKRLFIVEIDETVIDVSMKYFPNLFKLTKNVKENEIVVGIPAKKYGKNIHKVDLSPFKF